MKDRGETFEEKISRKFLCHRKTRKSKSSAYTPQDQTNDKRKAMTNKPPKTKMKNPEPSATEAKVKSKNSCGIFFGNIFLVRAGGI